MTAKTLPLRDLAGLSEEERALLTARLARLRTLEDVLTVGRLWQPGLTLETVVVQDEYTHDVVLRYRDERFLVFDTT